MELLRLTSLTDPLYGKAIELYNEAFPDEERRPAHEQAHVMTKEDYHFEVILADRDLVGIMLRWECGDLIFLEHFAILPDLRGRGYGAEALELLKSRGKAILLEIEPPVDTMTERRYGFYRRCGFVMNPYHHIQAKYYVGAPDLELKVLSYPRTLTPEEYRTFYEYMTREIGIDAG